MLSPLLNGSPFCWARRCLCLCRWRLILLMAVLLWVQTFAVGAIFGIYRGKTLLGLSGKDQVAAAYAVFGPQTVLVLACSKQGHTTSCSATDSCGINCDRPLGTEVVTHVQGRGLNRRCMSFH